MKNGYLNNGGNGKKYHFSGKNANEKNSHKECVYQLDMVVPNIIADETAEYMAKFFPPVKVLGKYPLFVRDEKGPVVEESDAWKFKKSGKSRISLVYEGHRDNFLEFVNYMMGMAPYLEFGMGIQDFSLIKVDIQEKKGQIRKIRFAGPVVPALQPAF